MHTARLKFKKMLDKVKQDKKQKKKRSWKPIMDRNHTSRSSSRSSSQGQVSDMSDSSSVLEMSGDNSLKNSMSGSAESDTKSKFMTSTPTYDKVRSAKRCGNTNKSPKSVSNSMSSNIKDVEMTKPNESQTVEVKGMGKMLANKKKTATWY